MRCCDCRSAFPSARGSAQVSLPSFPFPRCATLSWCSRRGVSWRASAWGAPGAGQAACLRAAWAPATGREGLATPLPTRKGLESWSPQGRTWDFPPWPWPPSPPNTAPAGSTPSAGRNTHLPTAAQLPVASPSPSPRCPTPLLSWEARKIHRSRRKRPPHRSRMCRRRSAPPHESHQHQPAKPHLSRLASPSLPRPTGGTPRGAGPTPWCPYRWVNFQYHPEWNFPLRSFHFLPKQEAVFGWKSRAAGGRTCTASIPTETRQTMIFEKDWRGVCDIVGRTSCVCSRLDVIKRPHNSDTDEDEWRVPKTKAHSHDSR